MFVLAQEGAEIWLGSMTGGTGPPYPDIHLMGTAGTPIHTWTAANYAALELPLANGYAPISLATPGSDWTQAAIPAGYQYTSIVLSWTFTAALTVYGWYALFHNISIAWGGEEFVPVFGFPSGGGLFTWQLPLQLISCPGVSAC